MTVYICTCPACGIVVRTENPAGETACGCRVPYTIEPETAE